MRVEARGDDPLSTIQPDTQESEYGPDGGKPGASSTCKDSSRCRIQQPSSPMKTTPLAIERHF